MKERGEGKEEEKVVQPFWATAGACLLWPNGSMDQDATW